MAYRRSDSRRRLIDPALSTGPSQTGRRIAAAGSSHPQNQAAVRPLERDMNTKVQVERMRFITREYVRANPDKTFLFGDNLEQRGYGGQAAAMRGEPNAVGIPTKKKPSMGPDAFFTDREFEQNKGAINLAFAAIAVTDATQAIVIPANGLGTGRAELDKRAPRTFTYLQSRLAELSDLLAENLPLIPLVPPAT